MEKKNIAFLLPDMTGGGAERVVSYLTQHLPEKEYKKYAFVFDSSRKDYDCRAEIVDIGGSNGKTALSRAAGILNRIGRAKRAKRDCNIDTTVSLMGAPNVVNILSRVRDRVIVSVRNFQSEELYSPSIPYTARIGGRMSIRLLYHKADAIVALSRGVGLDLMENFGVENEKVRVIYNPCDIEHLKCLSREKIEKEQHRIFEKPVVVTVGRLTYQKGQWHLLRAFQQVVQKIPDAQLVLLGRGEGECYLKELASGLDITDRVHFLGFKKNPFKFIARAQLFALSSLYEGFGNVITEAMACSVPVIACDCRAGPREILAPDTDITRRASGIERAQFGILTPPCDGRKYSAQDAITEEENMLADALVEMLQDAKTREHYRRKGLERVERFRMDNILEQWQKIL